MEKLKLCPFCGGEASCNNRGLNDKNGNPVWWAECLSCGASIEGTENTKGAAIAAWNKRAQDTEAKRRRTEQNPKPLTLDELREIEEEIVWVETDECKAWYRAGEAGSSGIRSLDGRLTTLKDADYGKTWIAYRTKPERSGEE